MRTQWQYPQPWFGAARSGDSYPYQKRGTAVRSRRPPKPAPTIEFVEKFRITQTAFDAIKETLGRYPAETGGLLLGNPETGLITRFLFDQDARASSVIYYPTVEWLNEQIPIYEAQGEFALGIAHSHPTGLREPSIPDLSAAYNNITSEHNGHIRTWHLPIIQSIADGKDFEFHPFIVSCSPSGEPVLHTPSLEIVGERVHKPRKKGFVLNSASTVLKPVISEKTLERLNHQYARVSEAVDFSKMLSTSIVHVGVGASSTTIEQMGRLGIKRWVLFDPDYVETKNLAVQNFEWSDIGKAKPEAMKERLVRCEFEQGAPDVPPLRVDTYGDFLEISDKALDQLIDEEKKAYDQVILVMATDFHPAQARGAKLGLRKEVPTFFIGAYQGGLAGEMIFTHPKKKDLPCYRCIAKSRYDAFERRAAKGNKQAATSSGLPFAIGVLDSQLAHLVVGCIHANFVGDESNPHAKLFRELLDEKRNFVQTQLNNGYRMGGVDIFRDENGVQGPNVKTFISLFQRDEKDANCPDCGNGC